MDDSSAAPMTISQIIYASQPFGFDNAMLSGILMDARRNNPRFGITGMLISRADIYLQLLEGPASAIEATFSRISRDNRHLNVRRLYSSADAMRLFPGWAMRDDPAHTWLWTHKEIADGALERASPSDVLGVFIRLAADPPPTNCEWSIAWGKSKSGRFVPTVALCLRNLKVT
jgi:hypothetical protein